MSRKIAKEALPRLRQRYVGRGREGRTRLIDEVCEQWDYSRKHGIKLLAGKAGWGGELGSRKRRPSLYGEVEEAVLWKIWKASEQPCGKRLKALLADWLEHYEEEQGKLDSKLRQKLLTISVAQMDRLLAACKVQAGYPVRCGTKRSARKRRPFQFGNQRP